MSDPTPQPAGNPAPEIPPAQPAAQSPATLTQEQFNAALAAEKRKWKEQQDAVAEKARKDAEDKAAQEKGEFEKLATERGARLAQVEAEHTTKTERIAAYETEMEKQMKARLKVLPEAIREMVPEGDLLTRYAWLDKAETAAAKLAPVQPAGPRGTPAGPRGTGSATPPAGTPADATLAQKRASVDYSL